MAEEATTTETETTETTETEVKKDDRPDQNVIAEERRKRQKAERDLRDMQARLEELETKDQSELERERKARAKAEQERQEFAQKVEQLEKGSWVRDAAAAANFHNPSAAASFLDLSEIEDAADAQRAIRDLAKREQYLVKPEETPRPQVGQVLKDGQKVEPKTPQEAAALQQREMVERDAEAVQEALTAIGVYKPAE